MRLIVLAITIGTIVGATIIGILLVLDALDRAEASR